jgi:hypothetical protein
MRLLLYLEYAMSIHVDSLKIPSLPAVATQSSLADLDSEPVFVALLLGILLNQLTTFHPEWYKLTLCDSKVTSVCKLPFPPGLSLECSVKPKISPLNIRPKARILALRGSVSGRERSGAERVQMLTR